MDLRIVVRDMGGGGWEREREREREDWGLTQGWLAGDGQEVDWGDANWGKW